MQTLTGESLVSALHQAQTQRYKEALATIKTAKESDPRNVYILAIEKQLTKLVEFTDLSSISEGEAHETYELLQILADRALGVPRRQGLFLSEATAPGFLSSHQSPQKTDHVGAVATLKRQYFSRADTCMKMGDYQGALFEIHRIYILDPGNQTAIDYEEKIQKLLSLQSTGTQTLRAAGASSEPPAVLERMTFGEDTATDYTESLPPEYEEPVVAREPSTSVGDADSIAEDEGGPLEGTLVPVSDSPEATELKVPRRVTMKRILTGGIVVLLLGASTYFVLWKKSNDARLLARFTENPETSIVAEKQGDANESQSKSENTNKRTQTKTAGTQPSSTKSNTETKTNGSPGAQTTHDGTSSAQSKKAESQDRANEARSSNADAAEKQREARQNDRATNVTEMVPQPIAVSNTKPLGSLTRRIEPPAAGGQFVAIQKEPKLLRLARIPFSAAIIEHGPQGQVVVRVRISAEGKPLEARVLKSSDPMLDQAVLEAVMNSDYSPGAMSTGPVTTWATIPFTFKR